MAPADIPRPGSGIRMTGEILMVSEFVIQAGSTVMIHAVFETADYCLPENPSLCDQSLSSHHNR